MVSFLTDTVVCGFSLYHILAYFLIYSCIGWCLEVIYAAATTGQLVNRGFLRSAPSTALAWSSCCLPLRPCSTASCCCI